MAEKLNIKFHAIDWRAQILSNLAHTPFRIGDHVFSCVESPLQGIKFRDISVRERVFKMNGMDALKAGRAMTLSIKPGERRYVYWQDEEIPYNSIEHRMLIAEFVAAKVRQNPKVQEALLETKSLFIYHDVGEESPNTSLPEPFYIETLLQQRRLLLILKKISL